MRAYALPLFTAIVLFSQTAQPANITFDDSTLGNGSLSWFSDGVTLLATANSSGSLTSIPPVVFPPPHEVGGIWIGRGLSSDGVYSLLFSQPVVDVELEFEGASGSNNPVESFTDFLVATGTPTLAYTNQQFTSFDGTTVSATQGSDFGEFIIRISATTPFTSLSFRHLQHLSNNGSVIERVTITTVPEPSVAILIPIAAAGAFAVRRQRN